MNPAISASHDLACSPKIYFHIPDPWDTSSESSSASEGKNSSSSIVLSQTSPINQILVELNFVRSPSSTESV
jgi:hypothetical protein